MDMGIERPIERRRYSVDDEARGKIRLDRCQFIFGSIGWGLLATHCEASRPAYDYLANESQKLTHTGNSEPELELT